MRRRFELTSLALGALAVGVAVLPGADKIDPDRVAKESAKRFLTAMRAKSLDDVMAAIDVPFALIGPCCGVIKDRDELRRMMSRGVEDKEPYLDGMEVKAVNSVDGPWKELTDSGKGECKGVLGPKDRIVTVVNKSGDGVVLFIRIRDGKAKVVGSGGPYREEK
jgi:hypothetical protein